jgi:cytoskeletal protein CcmA (bactofilin family)
MNNSSLSAHASAHPDAEQAVSTLRLSIEEHGIGMVIPPKAVFEGNLKLDCGVVVYGIFRGTIECKKGTAIIAPGAHFTGRLTAERIAVAGKVGEPAKAAKDSALLIASEDLQIGEGADIHAVIRAPLFNIPLGAKLNSSVIKSMLGTGAG